MFVFLQTAVITGYRTYTVTAVIYVLVLICREYTVSNHKEFDFNPFILTWQVCHRFLRPLRCLHSNQGGAEVTIQTMLSGPNYVDRNLYHKISRCTKCQLL